MAINNIYIFSRGIRTGKTTELSEWISGKENISGFLTPDVKDKRKLFNIETKEYFDLELPEDTTAETISIGKFLFSKKIFARATDILQHASKEWLIADEAGKLEIEHDKGLEPVLTATINKYKTYTDDKKLILVIRDTLVEKAVIKYELAGAKIIHTLTELC